jgi:hypothetical protein
MFSQTRDTSSWRGDCVLESQLPRLSRERHNLITSHSSWFALHAVYWNIGAAASSASSRSSGSSGSSSGSASYSSSSPLPASAPARDDESGSVGDRRSGGGALEFEAVVLAGGRGSGAPALRRVAMQRDPRLSLFGGTRNLSSWSSVFRGAAADNDADTWVPFFAHQVGGWVGGWVGRAGALN